MYSLLIKNATIIDGTGNPAWLGDVAVQGDTIASVGKSVNGSAEIVIDAQGKVLAPGFIDIQNHSDSYWQLFRENSFDSLVTQGITSIIVGQCGASLAPLLSPDSLYAMQKWHTLEGINVDWQSFAEFVKTLSKTKLGCNVASLVGYSTVRRGLVGNATRPLTQDELSTLLKIIEESLQSGAFGVSSTLAYGHEAVISESELIAVARVVAKNNSLLSIHLRNEAEGILESVDEVLGLAKYTKANIKISHLKMQGPSSWDKLPELLEKLETAWHQGQGVQFDVYPYTTSWQLLCRYLPVWAIEGGSYHMQKNLRDGTQRKKILSFLHDSDADIRELILTSAIKTANVVGKKISYIAKDMGISSEEAMLTIIENGGTGVMVFDNNLDDRVVFELMIHPLSFVATDGGGFSLARKAGNFLTDINRDKLIHPRCFGSMPKFLHEVTANKKIGLPDAIRKLTSSVAHKLGMSKRGQIKVGNFADLVIINLASVGSEASVTNPYQYSHGIDYVFVNGQAAVVSGRPTTMRGGTFLRKT